MSDAEELLGRIEEALEGVEQEGGDAFPPMASVKRQLLWCRAYLRGEETGDRPGPFDMGALAMRELDMYGDNPDLALEVYQIEREMEGVVKSRESEKLSVVSHQPSVEDKETDD
jgi:hypothetical protein